MILQHDTMGIISPIAMLNVPMRLKQFYLGEDADGNALDPNVMESYHSVQSFCEASGGLRKPTYSHDGTYFMFRPDIGYGKMKQLEAFATAQGLTFYTEEDDYTAELTGAEVFLLSIPELQEFMQVNPKFKQNEVV